MNKSTIITIACAACLTAGHARKTDKADAKYAGYVFAYFEGRGEYAKQEHLRFAISEDAKTWRTLNNNRPIISSDTISESGGIRDPHILRCEDGKTFCIVATDMNTCKFGWTENPGIVMLKSTDLINWTHAKVNLSKAYPKNFGDAYWVWAPQTIYDRKAKKYMIYFTLKRRDNDSLITYYAYANKDFTGFENEPEILFTAKYGCIDNDIIYKDGVYHMFYKGNIKDADGKELKNGIQQATAKSLRGKWTEDFKFIDPYAGTKTHVEGSGVFKLNGKEEYVLMYDLYSSGRYEYQTSKDLKTFSAKSQSFDKDFFPRHGTAMSLTADEMKRMQEHWGYVFDNEVTTPKEWSGNPILPGFHADPEIMYSNKTQRYYIYSTTDGHPGWGGWYFTCYSSKDLANWRYEGVALDVLQDTKWATGNAWAPAIIEKEVDGKYKYFFYYSANTGKAKAIGVAVAETPQGPFTDLGYPIIDKRPEGQKNGQQIDVDVFSDPDTGKNYLYWGNGYMAGAVLNDDMTSIDTTTIVRMTPPGGSLADYRYREAPYVFKRNGLYYFLWSVDDTGSPNYHVAYGTSKSPLGPIEVAEKPVILIQEPGEEIYGTAHNSVLQIPGKDEWYFVYHRINKDYLPKAKGPGYHREVCIDRLEFNTDGSIRRTTPTHRGIKSIK